MTLTSVLGNAGLLKNKLSLKEKGKRVKKDFEENMKKETYIKEY